MLWTSLPLRMELRQSCKCVGVAETIIAAEGKHLLDFGREIIRRRKHAAANWPRSSLLHGCPEFVRHRSLLARWSTCFLFFFDSDVLQRQCSRNLKEDGMNRSIRTEK